MVVFALSLQVFRKLLKDIYLNMSEENLEQLVKGALISKFLHMKWRAQNSLKHLG